MRKLIAYLSFLFTVSYYRLSQKILCMPRDSRVGMLCEKNSICQFTLLYVTELIDVGPLTRGLALPVTNCRWSSGLPHQIGRQASVLVKMLQYQALPTARQLPHFAACCSIQLDCSISQTEGYLLRDCTGLNPTTQLNSKVCTLREKLNN